MIEDRDITMTELDYAELKLPTEFNDEETTEETSIIDSNFYKENPEWKAARDEVNSNLNDITKWDRLVTLTEQLLIKYPQPQDSIKAIITKTFNELLARFPLFFGYWKKFVSLTYQIYGINESLKTLSRSLDTFPSSLELWLDYLTILISDEDLDRQVILAQFEKASKFIGYQFLSHPFWDKYIEYVTALKDTALLLKIYLHLITLPLHQYARYYQSFLDLKQNSIPITQLIEIDEDLTIPDGITSQQDVVNFVNDHYNNVFAKNQSHVTEIWNFESRLKQFFFNLSSLPADDLTIWEEYLDFQIQKYDSSPTILNKNLTISVFERCLIPTALYPKFWYKYLNWYYGKFSDEFEFIDSIYTRAVNLYIPINFIQIRFNYALFLELNGKLDESSEVYLSTIRYNTLLTEPVQKYLNFQSRTSGLRFSKTLEILISKYQDDKNGGSLEFYDRRFIKLINDRTFGNLITHYININYDKKSLVQKSLQKFANLDILKSSVQFWSLNYKFHKEINDLVQLNKIVQFIKLESNLPISTINNILLDYSNHLSRNFNSDSIFQTNHFQTVLQLEYEAANPLIYRFEKDEKSYQQLKRQSGHPNVFINKPQITNLNIDTVADRYEVSPLPTFKNVEKASLAIEYIQDE